MLAKRAKSQLAVAFSRDVPRRPTIARQPTLWCRHQAEPHYFDISQPSAWVDRTCDCCFPLSLSLHSCSCFCCIFCLDTSLVHTFYTPSQSLVIESQPPPCRSVQQKPRQAARAPPPQRDLVHLAAYPLLLAQARHRSHTYRNPQTCRPSRIRML